MLKQRYYHGAIWYYFAGSPALYGRAAGKYHAFVEDAPRWRNPH